ncbi:sigma 54-interacting transcriptional regulator [Haliangium ochraceum]|uniref:Sigma54 specific transcriptional regulator, Fis family n=1 Tax=Haliangium ochraceum (strain DSM 14365 / JCM 11303 / SMP-2) TaxID=502025 RepID=D0LR83_HALO1|nr:sigma 54-interacting transcriptional regulator [Haliangium ochraceum]ACY17111.1 sigma54 specific transcriptional regulator, Fis family [Haliangium ochraceum DSM 14365]
MPGRNSEEHGASAAPSPPTSAGAATRTLRETMLNAPIEVTDEGGPVPGLVLLHSRGAPACVARPLSATPLVLGRETDDEALPVDPNMSRRHLELRHLGGDFCVRDLGSRNGTFVDGAQVCDEHRSAAARVLRAGTSIFLLCPDIRPFRRFGVERIEDMVLGPSLSVTWRTLAQLARAGSNVFLRGESGSGKERAVQAFHAMGPRSGRPLVAVNCGAVPEGMAERLLFGTRRGAYSGAASDAEGYVQAADGGLLFLDEVAELDLRIQAKLLRVLETKQVLPLGENRPQQVDFLLCAATHKDLRAAVARGAFREDLYFRIARPEVVLPPLRERIEEIPWLIDTVVQQTAERPIAVHTSFVEACLSRPWPGNVRELIVETRAAVHQVQAEGRSTLKHSHLPERAGMHFEAAAALDSAEYAAQHPPGKSRGTPGRAEIVAALRAQDGNVSATARAMGVHRTQLRRWMERFGVDVQTLDQPAAD